MIVCDRNKLISLWGTQTTQDMKKTFRISKFFSPSLDQFFLTVGQNNFGNKIPNIAENGKKHLPK